MHPALAFLRDLGVAAAALVAIAAAAKLPGLRRPVRYAFRVLVGDPATAVMRAWLIPMIRNDIVPIIERVVVDLLAPVHRRLDSIDGAVNNRPKGSPTLSQDVSEVKHRVTKIEARQMGDHEKLAAIEELVTEPDNPESTG